MAVSPNHFLVRQCSLPGHLIVCPDRRVRLALPSTLNPVFKQRIQMNSARFRQPSILTASASVSQVVASNSLAQLASAQLTNGSELRRPSRDPYPSYFSREIKGPNTENSECRMQNHECRNLPNSLNFGIQNSSSVFCIPKCSVMDSNHQPSD